MIYQELCRDTHFQISITKEGKSNCNWHMVNDQTNRLSDLQQIAKTRTMKGDENDIYDWLFVMTVRHVWHFKIKTCNCSSSAIVTWTSYGLLKYKRIKTWIDSFHLRDRKNVEININPYFHYATMNESILCFIVVWMQQYQEICTRKNNLKEMCLVKDSGFRVHSLVPV